MRVVVVLLLIGLAAVSLFAYRLFRRPIPYRLGDEVRSGMPLGEVHRRATRLGFAWRVREDILMKVTKTPTGADAVAGHIVCHMPENKLVCENFADAVAFGALFTSYSCNIVMKAGVVEQTWLYQD